MTQERIQSVTSELLHLRSEVDNRFGRLSADQLDWKPDADAWSVAQCLDHLITTHGLYFPLLRRLEAGVPAPSLWEKWSPFSAFFGRILIRTMDPENRKKVKTSPKAQPSSSRLGAGIVARFGRHQAELIDLLRGIPDDVDLERTVITSPLAGLVTYSLDDCLTLFVIHGRRHFRQAERVLEAAGFPGSPPPP